MAGLRLLVTDRVPGEERRARIRLRLRQLGPGPLALFEDICTLVDSDVPLVSRSMLISHLLRELESAIRAVLVPIEARRPREPSQGSGHRDEVEAMLAALGIEQTSAAARAWLAEVGKQHGYAHRPGLDQPKPVDDALVARVDGLEAAFDVVLDRFDARYCAMADQLEALAATVAPTKEDAARLRQEFPQDQLTLEMFFSQLQGPAWLRPLHKKKIFAFPPPPQIDSEAGTVAFPVWPASSYLVRVAAVEPATVLDVAAQIPATENPRVNLDLVEVALLVPPAKSRRLVPRVVAALRGPYLIGPERYAQLAVRCAEQGEDDHAIALLTALLDVDAEEREARIGDYMYAEILRTHGAVLPGRLGMTWLQTLVSLLDQALGRGGLTAGRAGGEDLSQVWFAALEAGPSIPHADTRALLTTAVRDSAEQLAADAQTGLANVLAAIDAQPWLVFRRLRLYLLERHGSQLPEMVQDTLTSPSHMHDRRTDREWRRLARAHAGDLPSAARTALLATIVAGPDTEAWRQRYRASSGGEEPAADRVEDWAGLWRRDRYAAVEALLTDELHQRYEELCDRFGPAASLDDVPEVFRFSWAPPSSITAGELATKSPTDLVAYLATWTPSETWAGTDSESFARELRAAVSSQALAFCAHAETFADLADEHLATVLGGFYDAAQAGVVVDWAPLCGLAATAVSRTGTPHSSQAHRQAALLLWTGLSHYSNLLPAELSDSVWETITTVLHTPPSSTADSLDDDDQDYCWGDAREQALRAAVAWACWRHRHGTDYWRLFTTLEAMLTKLPLARQRGEQAVATVIGSLFNQLHALDPAWARNHIPLLSAPTSFGRTAWQAYLSSAQPAQPTAVLLLDAYRTAARTPTSTDNDYYQQALRRRLGEHLLILYLNGQVELDGHDSPLADYYATSSPKTTQELAASVGEALHAGDLPEEVRYRLQAWWEWRVADVARELDQDPLAPSRDELLTLVGPLVSSRLFPVNWLLEQLSLMFHLTGTFGRDARVFTFLAATAADTPGPVLELLTDWVLTLDVADWSPRLREADLRTILLAGLRAPDHHDLAAAIISRAAARGHRQFRPLLAE